MEIIALELTALKRRERRSRARALQMEIIALELTALKPGIWTPSKKPNSAMEIIALELTALKRKRKQAGFLLSAQWRS